MSRRSKALRRQERRQDIIQRPGLLRQGAHLQARKRLRQQLRPEGPAQRDAAQVLCLGLLVCGAPAMLGVSPQLLLCGALCYHGFCCSMSTSQSAGKVSALLELFHCLPCSAVAASRAAIAAQQAQSGVHVLGATEPFCD